MQLITAIGVYRSGVLLRSGGQLRVPGRGKSNLFMMDELGGSLRQPLRSSRLTLNQLWGESGGTNAMSAKQRQTCVLRGHRSWLPKSYHAGARSPGASSLPRGLELEPHGIAYVDLSFLGSRNRIISLILPLHRSAELLYLRAGGLTADI